MRHRKIGFCRKTRPLVELNICFGPNYNSIVSFDTISVDRVIDFPTMNSVSKTPETRINLGADIKIVSVVRSSFNRTKPFKPIADELHDSVARTNILENIDTESTYILLGLTSYLRYVFGLYVPKKKKIPREFAIF